VLDRRLGNALLQRFDGFQCRGLGLVSLGAEYDFSVLRAVAKTGFSLLILVDFECAHLDPLSQAPIRLQTDARICRACCREKMKMRPGPQEHLRRIDVHWEEDLTPGLLAAGISISSCRKRRSGSPVRPRTS